ncbi:hypothetical protein OPV22_030510 [Ensete ventricosum]|uniref:Uncharacterized protein n=1 Tax=Ensete ventricosum TaxID=4639 RepID=A0AAV8QE70_ENSVE|nr:hypothetical protein OPV22_030510 [Ensete ventricosum]
MWGPTSAFSGSDRGSEVARGYFVRFRDFHRPYIPGKAVPISKSPIALALFSAILITLEVFYFEVRMSYRWRFPDFDFQGLFS